MTPTTHLEQSNAPRKRVLAAARVVEGNALCALVEAFAAPDQFEIAWRDGELFIEPRRLSGLDSD